MVETLNLVVVYNVPQLCEGYVSLWWGASFKLKKLLKVKKAFKKEKESEAEVRFYSFLRSLSPTHGTRS